MSRASETFCAVFFEGRPHPLVLDPGWYITDDGVVCGRDSAEGREWEVHRPTAISWKPAKAEEP